ncbi:MAG: T9SS type A sorting domain-containing protein, partial [Ferruginibacter sp.]|nr:T9SS type A sorting domain-containing protein [Ferruginibacter sp.]
SYTDGHTTMLRVINCGIVLSTNLTQFNGQLIEKKASLYWTATNEKDLSMYEIEKSNDGANFYKSGTVKAKNMNDVYYNYTDPVNVTGKNYYRLKMIDANGLFKYSNVIVLSSELDFEISNINNPFSNTIKADVSVPKDGRLNVILFNENGQLVKNLRIKAHKGLNKITVDNIEAANGIYFLSVDFENGAIKRKLLKINQ